ncbi:MAG: clostripain-related cysteine peptidase, partial [Magnetococcus sp. WYHC-3]
GSSVELAFNHARGDLDMTLYDAQGQQVGGSYGVGNSETVSLNSLSAGTYYLQVYGWNNAVNPDYTLSITQSVASDDTWEDNDTAATASDLDVLSGQDGWANLAALDDDWYRFTLDHTAGDQDAVQIAFDQRLGDLDLALYNTSEQLLGSSTGVGNVERIELEGLTAGDYLLRVSGYAGAVNPVYHLGYNVVASSGGSILADAYESNDTRATATVLRDNGSITGLTIDSADDEDWFTFTTAGRGTSGHEFTLHFEHDAGDVDVALYAASGEMLRQSVGVGDGETIRLEGLNAGTYSVRVYGFNDATNPDYSLTLNAPLSSGETISGDVYENNDSAATATQLGTLRGAYTLESASVEAGDDDWYAFTTITAGSATITLNAAGNPGDGTAYGDLDLTLFASDGTTVLGASTSGDADESISLSNLAAGSYLVRVEGYRDASHPDYDLALNLPTNEVNQDYLENNNSRTAATVLRSGAQGSLEGLTLHAGDDDWFSFTSTRTGVAGDAVEITSNTLGRDVTLELVDSSGAVVSSDSMADGVASLSLTGVAAGSYAIHVGSATDAVLGDYTLNTDLPIGEVSTSGDAWTVMVYLAGDNNLEYWAQDNINRMERIDLPENVNVVFLLDRTDGEYDGGGDWTDTRYGIVARDRNTQNITSPMTSLGELDTGSATTLTSFINQAATDRPADNYALVIMDHGGGLSGVAWDESSNGNNLTIAEVTSAIANSSLSHLDLVGFDACLQGMVEQAYDLRSVADVVTFSQNIEWAPGWNYPEVLQGLADDPGMTATELGTVIVDAFGAYHGNDDTQSAIDMSDMAALRTAINGFVSAVQAGATSADWSAMAMARNAANAYYGIDHYRDLGGFMEAVANASGVTAAIDTAATAVVSALNGAVIRQVAYPEASGMSVYFPGPGAGMFSIYNANALDFVADSTWDDFLRLFSNNAPNLASGSVTNQNDDAAESTNFMGGRVRSNNDTPYESTDLGTWGSGTYDVTDLNISLGDEDWFTVRLNHDGAAGDVLDVLFEHASGDLNAELYDANGTLISGMSSTSTDDNESLSLADLVADTDYLLRVFGADDTVSNPAYALRATISGTDVAPDMAEGDRDNNAASKATQLGSAEDVNASLRLDNLNLDDGDRSGGDFYYLQAAQGNEFNFNVVALRDLDTSLGSLTLNVYDAQNNLITSLVTDSAFEAILFSPQQQGAYVQVLGPSGSEVDFTYTLEVAQRVLDVDGDGDFTYEEDFFMVMDYVYGAPQGLVAQYAGDGASRDSGAEVVEYFELANLTMFDIDGNGSVVYEQDVFALIDYAFGAPVPLIMTYFAENATRTTEAQVQSFLDAISSGLESLHGAPSFSGEPSPMSYGGWANYAASQGIGMAAACDALWACDADAASTDVDGGAADLGGDAPMVEAALDFYDDHALI